jgi:GxxExxY protein
LQKRGLTAERQKPMPIVYDNIRFDEAFRSDLVVNGKIIAELKSVESLQPVHAKQILTQLRLSGLKLGLLINFGEAHLKNRIKRVINGHLDAKNPLEFSL